MVNTKTNKLVLNKLLSKVDAITKRITPITVDEEFLILIMVRFFDCYIELVVGLMEMLQPYGF